jgi:hypothetical protein
MASTPHHGPLPSRPMHGAQGDGTNPPVVQWVLTFRFAAGESIGSPEDVFSDEGQVQATLLSSPTKTSPAPQAVAVESEQGVEGAGQVQGQAGPGRGRSRDMVQDLKGCGRMHTAASQPGLHSWFPAL